MSTKPEGPTTPDNVDDRVAAWHDGAGMDMPLHEYLGWNWGQYKDWVEHNVYPYVPRYLALDEIKEGQSIETEPDGEVVYLIDRIERVEDGLILHGRHIDNNLVARHITPREPGYRLIDSTDAAFWRPNSEES